MSTTDLSLTRSQRAQKIEGLLRELDNALVRSGATDVGTVLSGHDIHGFYPFADHSAIFHVQGYPGFSSDKFVRSSTDMLPSSINISGNPDTIDNVEGRMPLYYMENSEYSIESLMTLIRELSPETADRLKLR